MTDRTSPPASVVERLSGLGAELPPPMKTRPLLALEAKIGCELPKALRDHVRNVANGGPGPNGGLWTLEEGLAQLATPADASGRFPLTAKEVDALVADKQTDASVVHDDEARPLPLRGVLPIADEGCGLMVAIVTRGKRAGQLWLVGGAWTPLLDDDGTPLRFSAWWSRWLEGNEADAPRQAPAKRKTKTTTKTTTTTPKSKAQADAPELDPAWPKTLRRALSKPTQIKKLALSFDHEAVDLEALPDVFETLTALEQLDINNSFELRALPPSIGRLTSVKKVWLTSLPRLESIAPVTALAKLEFLNVSRCRDLRALPHDLGHLVHLRELIAMFTGLRSLPDSLGSAPKLKRLWLHTSFHLDMKTTWPVIARMPALTHLALAEGRFRSWPSGALTAPPALVDLDITRAELPKRIAASMRAWPGVTVRE